MFIQNVNIALAKTKLIGFGIIGLMAAGALSARETNALKMPRGSLTHAHHSKRLREQKRSHFLHAQFTFRAPARAQARCLQPRCFLKDGNVQVYVACDQRAIRNYFKHVWRIFAGDVSIEFNGLSQIIHRKLGIEAWLFYQALKKGVKQQPKESLKLPEAKGQQEDFPQKSSLRAEGEVSSIESLKGPAWPALERLKEDASCDLLQDREETKQKRQSEEAMTPFLLSSATIEQKNLTLCSQSSFESRSIAAVESSEALEAGDRPSLWSAQEMFQSKLDPLICTAAEQYLAQAAEIKSVQHETELKIFKLQWDMVHVYFERLKAMDKVEQTIRRIEHVNIEALGLQGTFSSYARRFCELIDCSRPIRGKDSDAQSSRVQANIEECLNSPWDLLTGWQSCIDAFQAYAKPTRAKVNALLKNLRHCLATGQNPEEMIKEIDQSIERLETSTQQAHDRLMRVHMQAKDHSIEHFERKVNIMQTNISAVEQANASAEIFEKGLSAAINLKH